MIVFDGLARDMNNTSTIINTSMDPTAKQSRRAKGHKSARGKGEGTLKLRGGIYHAQVTINGKTYYRSTKTGNLREAKANLAKFVALFSAENKKAILKNISLRLQGIQGEIDEAEAQKPALSIADAWNAYERATNRPDSGPRTLSGYEGQYKIFENWIKEKHPNTIELRHVTQDIANEFISHIGASRSANTYNKYKTFLNCFWEVLKETGKLTINPWSKIRRKIDIGHSRRELTVEELCRVINSAVGEMKTLFAIAIYTGLRLGDCVLLEWGHVDLARNIISIIPRKTARHMHGKPTMIPIHPVLASVLIKSGNRTGYILPELAELYKRRPDALTYRIQKHFHNCGIKTTAEKTSGKYNRVDVGFHSFRHTFVSLSANAGVPLAFVQAIVGHSTPAMTAHYFHKDENALRSATAAIPDVINIKSSDPEEKSMPPTTAKKGLLNDLKSLALQMTTEELINAIEYLKTLVTQ